MEQRRKPTHPGVVLLEDVIKPLEMTITEAAFKLGVTRKALSELVHEKVALSPDMAVRIAKSTDTSAESWLAMQNTLDLWKSSSKPLKVIPFPKGSRSEDEILEG